MYDTYAVPLAERRMTRFLWKVIHLQENGWLVPTKRLIAAILMSGKIGYPSALFKPIAKLAEAGVHAKNRIIYDNPKFLISSLYALDIGTFLNPCYAMKSVGLLYEYEDRFGDKALIEKYSIDTQRLKQTFQERIEEDIDLIDKFTADRVEAHLDLQRFPHYLSAVIDATIRDKGFPLVFHPKVCELELQRLNNPAYLLIALERELTAHLPDQVLTFRDLFHPTLVEASTPLRELVQRIAKGEILEQNALDWEEAINYSCAQINTVGVPYRALVLEDIKELPDDKVFKIDFYVDMDAIHQTLQQDPALRFHRTVSIIKCIENSNESLQPLFLLSKSLGLVIPTIADMLRGIAGTGFASDDIIGSRVRVM